jgi:endonuclease/exonuclease/phosphatase family metal-dependent hydrolase
MRYIRFCLLFLCLTPFVSAQHLNVATYNIRCENRGDNANGNGWNRRCPEVVNLIRNHDFDLFGAQEVVVNQLNDLQTSLPEYAHVGVGRDDGKSMGEFSPIFYKKYLVELLNSGTFWLSPIDSVPNVGWDAALPRICTWAKFQLKNGTKFWFFNLHMDHLGKVARLESAKLVQRKIREMCGNGNVILTGDFNMDQNSEGYKISAETLADTYLKAEERHATKPTFNDYNLHATGDSRIDHIFVSIRFEVIGYDIVTDTYQKDSTRLPSDHYPVRAELILN